MAKSFLQRITPAAPRWRAIDWPFAVDGDAPRVAVLVLGGDVFDEVALALEQHFNPREKGKLKAPRVLPTDERWQSRERAELVFRAFRELDAAGNPSDMRIAGNVDEIVEQPPQVRDLLYTEWASMQAEVAPPRYGQKDLDELVEHLKKNSPSAVLGGWPSTLLIALITTLVSRLGASTEAS